MRIILTALLSLLVSTQAFAGYKQTYNSQSGLPDFVGAQASSDIGIVCASGQILTTTGSGTWACGASGGGSSTGCPGVVKTTDYTLTASDCTVIFDTSGGAKIATLTTAVGATALYNVKRSGASNVTIDTTSSQTIDGDLTAVLIVDKTSLQLSSDGSNWRVV